MLDGSPQVVLPWVMVDQPILRYRWRYTWPDKDEDYIGMDEDFKFGRFFIAPAGAVAGQWQYGLQNISHPSLRSQYMHGTAREVAAVIEALYDRMLPLVDGVGAQIAREIALFERKGLPLPPGTAWRQARDVHHLSREDADRIRAEVAAARRATEA